MSYGENVTMDERYKYFRQMKKQYGTADKRGCEQLLDDMEAMAG